MLTAQAIQTAARLYAIEAVTAIAVEHGLSTEAIRTAMKLAEGLTFTDGGNLSDCRLSVPGDVVDGFRPYGLKPQFTVRMALDHLRPVLNELVARIVDYAVA